MLKNKNLKQSGFTLVELLIVIVIIAILAAITIVAYNGIQNRAKTSSAQAAAETLQKKAEAANAIASSYPAVLADFNAQSDSSLTGSGITSATTLTSAPGSPATLQYYGCSSPAGGGYKINYWNYTTGAAVAVTGGSCTTYATVMPAGGPY